MASVDPDGGPPFFIVGSARSGTTLLRLMLNAHPDVAVPPESRFITELWRGQKSVRVDDFLAQLQSHKQFGGWALSLDAVRKELGENRTEAGYSVVVRACFRAYARERSKSRWGDKTPRYIEHIPLLAELFEDARFVHLVRDGRNVALSYADVPFGPKTVAKAAALWKKRVEAGIRDGRALPSGRYIEMCYEDLVEDTGGEIKSLCEFLDLPYADEMLDYAERSRSEVLPRAARYNPHVTERPLSQVRAWQDDMPRHQVEVFEAIAGDVLLKLGYKREFPKTTIKARARAVAGLGRAPIDRLKPTRRGN